MQGRATLLDSLAETGTIGPELTAVALVAEHPITARRLVGVLHAENFEITAKGRSVAALLDPPPLLVVACDAASLENSSELGTALSEMRSTLTVICSPAAGRHCVRKALAIGAVGYVTDADAETTLGATLRAVLAGQVCVPQSMNRQLDRPAFSFREKQVLELVARGMTNSQIAQRLFLAESTVKTHLSTSFRKLGVRSRKDAASVVLDPDLRIAYGLFTVPESDVALDHSLPALAEDL
jgi:DNA-binding NarL/FixJ family response regulator